MPRIETAEGELFYTLKKGPEGGPVLVLVHGAGGSRLHWPSQLRRLPRATVYSLDLPGHGRSKGDGCQRIDCYADSVLGFLNAVKVSRAVIVGHSMGGAIAQTLALQAAEQISAVVLVGTGARLRVARAILEGIQNDFEAAIDLITWYAWSQDAESSLTAIGRKALWQTGSRVLLGDFVACDRFDVMADLPDIRVPTLVITGTADKLTPVKYARYLAERIPRARLVTVEGAGHMVMLERPEQVADAVREFVIVSR
jgi:pimeloyl-ACP methyl ester carboxylesterase